MQSLLTLIVTWLSFNFGLPAIYDHPRIERVSQEKMAAVRYGGPVASRPASQVARAERAPLAARGPEVEALYDDASRTIYLDEKWTGSTPREMSVLVHEMVHHLQHAAGMKYECPQAREKLAYAAQDRWLSLFGLNLMDEFRIDPMTLLVRTHCMH
jgi:Domain of unknown function (DUF6647)